MKEVGRKRSVKSKLDDSGETVRGLPLDVVNASERGGSKKKSGEEASFDEHVFDERAE